MSVTLHTRAHTLLPRSTGREWQEERGLLKSGWNMDPKARTVGVCVCVCVCVTQHFFTYTHFSDPSSASLHRSGEVCWAKFTWENCATWWPFTCTGTYCMLKHSDKSPHRVQVMWPINSKSVPNYLPMIVEWGMSLKIWSDCLTCFL